MEDNLETKCHIPMVNRLCNRVKQKLEKNVQVSKWIENFAYKKKHEKKHLGYNLTVGRQLVYSKSELSHPHLIQAVFVFALQTSSDVSKSSFAS